MCAQNAWWKASHSAIAASAAPMHAASIPLGLRQRERRHITSVTTTHATADTAKTHPCGAPGLIAA